ncbi:hypothetical protein BKI52_35335 [marine bacterium AO1-C]|nr:hypothetical protein BKI52_35335 [marine bacterium AO1-C]
MQRHIIKANDWFAKGQRLNFDYQEKRIKTKESVQTLNVFQRLIHHRAEDQYCITMLPGFPDGSFGWARVEAFLEAVNDSPRLYIEYVGQGDSDKPAKYPYGISERADLVEALWAYYGIESTFVVTFDYSSLVALELLRRQQEGSSRPVQISKVLLINGGLFADAHSHPYMTTPLLKTQFGKMGTRFVQKSQWMFKLMMKSLWSKEYGVTQEELNELFEVIPRRNGALFLHNAATFVDEHKHHAQRLDLLNIYKQVHEKVDFHIVGSVQDQFEPQQIVKAKERLGKYNIDIRMLPGGHMTTSEHPDLLGAMIQELDK